MPVRTKVNIPPNSTGQAIGFTTYTNANGDTVAAYEMVITDPDSGLPAKPKTWSSMGYGEQSVRVGLFSDPRTGLRG